MRVAIAVHEGRVSPVLDVARRLLVVETDGQPELLRQTVSLADVGLAARVREIQATGATALVCGAVSRPLAAALHAAGIRVFSQVCGPTEDVLAAFLSGRLDDPVFAMPGCCRQRRRHRRGCSGGGRRLDAGAARDVRRDS